MPEDSSTIAPDAPVKVRKKLIEVALPLEAINIASAREKSIRHGHPSTLHLWWARRPLAAARAVIFCQMVDDPSEYVDVLREDPKLRRRAEAILKARMKVWEEAKAVSDQAIALGLDAPAPGPEPALDDVLADQERQRLFRIIEQLVSWENTTNETVLQAARDEIWASWRRTALDNIDHPRAKELFDRHALPAFHDPFAGGGALPLEAQRLGLEAHASDLNPVAVLINKAMIEIPPKFAGVAPVNPVSRATTAHSGSWNGAAGLAEDVRYFGRWMRDEAEKRIGHNYLPIEITPDMAADRPDLHPYVGRNLPVFAWLWVRTVKSPNPAFAQVDVPLASTFMLSTKPGKEVYVEPVIEEGGYRFSVRMGKPKDVATATMGTKSAGRGANFRCLMSGVPISGEYISREGMAGRLGVRLMAVVADGNRGKLYLPPVAIHEVATHGEPGPERPLLELPKEGGGGRTNFWCVRYGLTHFADLFTDRQLVALTTFSDLVSEARECARREAIAAGFADDPTPLREGGIGATAYAEAVSLYLGFAVDRFADYWTSLGRWQTTNQQLSNLFGRQGIPMMWDFPEANPFSGKGGSFDNLFDWTTQAIGNIGSWGPGRAEQLDAGLQDLSTDKVVSTDPPYYDNIGYADLSDFFYVWLRRSLRHLFPELFATLAAPKAAELVATPYRQGGKAKAESFFLEGMTRAIGRLADQAHPAFPVTIYYAFKQSESDAESGTASTGWETFLDAVVRAGFCLTGTWPIRTEMKQRMINMETNALASSIVLVCRPRPAHALVATRRELVSALKAELPAALDNLQRGNIAPVDLAQAAIGPGMAVYSRYEKVLDAEGQPLSVRAALALINQTLDEALSEQEGDFDADSRWALAWYEQFGFATGDYGVAEQLSKSKNTSVAGMVSAGILESKAGKVRLLRPVELDASWDPAADRRRPAWQAVHQLIQAADRGEAALADLIRKLGPEADVARELAYRLYVLSERKKRTTEALWYNGLVQSWTEAVRLAAETPTARPVQGELFGEG